MANQVARTSTTMVDGIKVNLGKVTPTTPTGNQIKPILKKSQSLEYKRSDSKERLVTNIWDRPIDYSKQVLADQKQQKVAAKAAKRAAVDTSKPKRAVATLDGNKKALKQVLHRKEQLESILSHLNEKGQPRKAKSSTSTVKRVKNTKKQPKILSPYLPIPPPALAAPQSLIIQSDIPIEETQHLLDFQKLFCDVPNTIELEREIHPAIDLELKIHPAIKLEESPNPPHLEDNESEVSKVPALATADASTIYPTQAVQVPQNDLEEKTHRKLQLFEQSLNKFPTLMRQFYSRVPKTKEDGGLSVTEQGRVIHFGIKLETKVLELIDQYNSFIHDIEEVVSESQK